MSSVKQEEVSNIRTHSEYPFQYGFQIPPPPTLGVLREKGVLENFAKLTGKHLWRRCFPMNFPLRAYASAENT